MRPARVSARVVRPPRLHREQFLPQNHPRAACRPCVAWCANRRRPRGRRRGAELPLRTSGKAFANHWPTVTSPIPRQRRCSSSGIRAYPRNRSCLLQICGGPIRRGFCAHTQILRIPWVLSSGSAEKCAGTAFAMGRLCMSTRIEKFNYDDDTVRKFVFATAFWAVVATLVGLWLAVMLVAPSLNFGLAQLSFGRLRPLHTNAAIFAFAGNGIFAAIYYSSQRLLKARTFSDALSKLHFWGWQAIIVAAALTLPFGITQSKEYAELEWHIDLAIWFYVATIITIAILHIFNNLSLPVTLSKSYSVYGGVQDAFMQWWYGHNAVAFFLTTPFLGLMYYFLPKAAERPVFSYKLSILHFW